MSRDQGTYRLTFNNAAGAQFIPEGTKGFLISLKDDRLVFEPVRQSSGFHVAPLTFRARGGVEMEIGGERGQDLIEFLTQTGTVAKPYYSVEKLPATRFTVAHYDMNKAPPKGWPHMRLWFPKDAADSTAQTTLAMFTIHERMNYFRSMIVEARRTLDQAADERKIGRPSKTVLAAREAMAQFIELAEMVIPSFKNEAHQEAVAEALKILNRVSNNAAKINRDIARDTQDFQTFPKNPRPVDGQIAPEGMGGQLLIVGQRTPHLTGIVPAQAVGDAATQDNKTLHGSFMQAPHHGALDQHAAPRSDKAELSYIRDVDLAEDETPEQKGVRQKSHWDRARLRGTSMRRRA